MGLGGWLEHYLRPAIIPRIEMFVDIRAFSQLQAMRNDLGRLGPAMVDELGEAAVVGLHVCLPGADLLTFEPERAEIEGHLALLGQIVLRTRIFRHAPGVFAPPVGAMAQVAAQAGRRRGE